MGPFNRNKRPPLILAATEICDGAATSAVACATARILLVCVHDFAFMVKKFYERQQHFAFTSFNFSKRELKSLLNFSNAFQSMQ